MVEARCAAPPHYAAPVSTDTRAVGASPPKVKVGEQLNYDKSTLTGTAAAALLATWSQATSAAMPAPWRMTAGSGGSEFGSLKWHDTLKSGFGRQNEDVPVFKLWQLALADHVVRPAGALSAVNALTDSLRRQRSW